MDFEGDEYRDRVHHVWDNLHAHGLVSHPYGGLETGHNVTLSYSNPHAQWYANLWHPEHRGDGSAHVLWLGDKDEEVPGRFTEGLMSPGTRDYLRSTMS